MKITKQIEIEVSFPPNTVNTAYAQFIYDAIEEITEDLEKWCKQYCDQNYPWGKLQIKVKTNEIPKT